ncbi:hypothetical protein JOF53_001002 [Crossiella equi]|uniref:Uncharacterized protein n=1 Tax=Crossiella equi TaxID=130796 RepID=A0ABS5A6A4_9PSEU|nr:hypothetical protein [Crossiella equi]MBP2472130.1 hypothetical protein [Crossiella equi]
MRKILSRAAVTAAVVGSAALLTSQVAVAKPESATCQRNYCTVVATDFPGGTISVDGDVHGTGNAYLQVWGPNGYYCKITIRAEWGPGSWLCFNAPAGTYSAGIDGPQGPSNVGLRW